MTDCPTYGGWAITKSSTPYRHVDFKVVSRLFYRLTSFNFASLLDRYGKSVPGRNLRLVRASLSSRCCWIATAKLSSFFLIVHVFLFVSSLLDRHGKAIQLIRLVRASLFVLLLLDRYAKAVKPSHIVRVYLFVSLMLDPQIGIFVSE